MKLKRVLIIGLFMNSTAILASSIEDRIYSRNIANVTISFDKDSCSRIYISYWPLVRKDANIPIGVLGNGQLGFIEPVLTLTPIGKYFLMPMKETTIMEAKELSPDSTMYDVFNDGIETQVGLDLKAHFELIPGEFYLHFSYVWQSRQEGNDYFYNELKSERYYLKIDENKCLQNFKP